MHAETHQVSGVGPFRIGRFVAIAGQDNDAWESTASVRESNATHCRRDNELPSEGYFASNTRRR